MWYNKEMNCIQCGNIREKGRRLCRTCHLSLAREKQRARHKIQGRYSYNNICKACSKVFKACRKTQILCQDCYKESLSHTQDNNSYQYVGHRNHKILHQHRVIAEVALGRQLSSNEVVHHLDCDPINNNINNLVVIDPKSHKRLHTFLRQERIITEKSGCPWKPFIILTTTAWLYTNNINVIKLVPG